MTRMPPPQAPQGVVPVWYQNARRRVNAGVVVLAVVGIVVAVAALVTVLQYLVGVLGLGGVVVNAAVAVVPLVFVLAVVRWVDRWEPEPFVAQVFAFLWGAGVSVAVALLVDETLTIAAFRAGVERTDMFALGIQSPIVEETAKGIGVLVLYLVLRRTFDGPVDGVVYAATIAAGFAFVENIQYFGLAFQSGGAERLAYTFYVRGILSPFAHLTFTSCTGIALGFAARERRASTTALYFVTGLLCAMLLHAGFNFGTELGDRGSVWYYALVEVPVFAAVIVYVLLARRRDARLTYAALDVYAQAGWFTPEEVAMLGTSGGRRAARRWAKARHGRAGRLMGAFIRDATQLAYTRQRIHSDHGRLRALRDEEMLLRSIAEDRARLNALGR